MIDAFRTIGEPANARLNEKKSRFLAFLAPVSSMGHADEELAGLRRRYHDATHHCSAYRILNGEEVLEGSNDDGEPSGSAGLPILQQLQKADLVNILAVVVRYYGGTKLGVGGLVRAYGGAAAEALVLAPIVVRKIETVIRITFPAEVNSGVMGTIHKHSVKVLGIEYDASARVQVSLPPSRVDAFCAAIKEATGDRATVEVES